MATEAFPVAPMTSAQDPTTISKPPTGKIEVVELAKDQLSLFEWCAANTCKESAIDPVVFPDGWGEERIEFSTARAQESFDKKGVQFLGIFSPDKKFLIAGAKWRLEDEDTHDEPEPPPEEMYAPGMNRPLVDAFIGGLTTSRKEIMGRRTYWHLQILVTLPSYHRRGAGRMLLKWGMDRADAAGLECYLDATEMGRSLYEQFSFEALRDNSIDLRLYVKDPSKLQTDFDVTYAMVRKPQTSEK